MRYAVPARPDGPGCAGKWMEAYNGEKLNPTLSMVAVDLPPPPSPPPPPVQAMPVDVQVRGTPLMDASLFLPGLLGVNTQTETICARAPVYRGGGVDGGSFTGCATPTACASISPHPPQSLFPLARP